MGLFLIVFGIEFLNELQKSRRFWVLRYLNQLHLVLDSDRVRIKNLVYEKLLDGVLCGDQPFVAMVYFLDSFDKESNNPCVASVITQCHPRSFQAVRFIVRNKSPDLSLLLAHACFHGNVKVVDLLLRKGSAIDSSVITEAVQGRPLPVIRALLRQIRHKELLIEAANLLNRGMVEFLVQLPPEDILKEVTMEVAQKGSVEVLRMLLEYLVPRWSFLVLALRSACQVNREIFQAFVDDKSLCHLDNATKGFLHRLLMSSDDNDGEIAALFNSCNDNSERKKQRSDK